MPVGTAGAGCKRLGGGILAPTEPRDTQTCWGAASPQGCEQKHGTPSPIRSPSVKGGGKEKEGKTLVQVYYENGETQI